MNSEPAQADVDTGLEVIVIATNRVVIEPARFVDASPSSNCPGLRGPNNL